MPEEFKMQEEGAPFNMALATLEALRAILYEINRIYINPHYPDEVKQKLKIDMVKRFYVDSSPLLKEDVVNKYKDILDLKPAQKEVMSDEHGELSITNNSRLAFTWELETKLDNYLISLQVELQKEKYFMPPKKDLGRSVGRF